MSLGQAYPEADNLKAQKQNINFFSFFNSIYEQAVRLATKYDTVAKMIKITATGS